MNDFYFHFKINLTIIKLGKFSFLIKFEKLKNKYYVDDNHFKRKRSTHNRNIAICRNYCKRLCIGRLRFSSKDS
ncbi:hypothetical protein EMIT036CA2_20788 [Chryseobacterium sp. IT-36CA2]